jgi:hypothetical protein
MYQADRLALGEIGPSHVMTPSSFLCMKFPFNQLFVEKPIYQELMATHRLFLQQCGSNSESIFEPILPSA